MTKPATKKVEFKDTDILSRNTEDYLFTEVDGESVAMNVESGAYFGMNQTCTQIWHAFDKDLDFDTLIKELTVQYDVTEETCRKETRAAIARLLKSNILTRKEA